MDKNWILDFSGCDGGTIGSSDTPAIWVCGIEWGEGHSAKSLQEDMNKKWNNSPIFGKEQVEYYPYNFVTYKLLAIMRGFTLENDNYRIFVEKEKPFLLNSPSSYFKLNLYPISFRNTSHSCWTKEIAEVSGFQTKRDYLVWCKENRFPVMQQWVQKYAPKLIICFGKTYAHEFNLAFSDNNAEFTNETVGDLVLQWKKNDNGTIIAVVPFPNAPNKGLKSHVDIEAMGKRLAQLK